MELSEIDSLSALAHPTRLAAFRLLVRRAPGGVPAGEIAAALGVRPNTLSQQLAILTHAGLVEAERQGRSIRYRILPERSRALIAFLAADCCRGRPDLCAPLEVAARLLPAGDRPVGVLFLCTGNSARSIMAEALLQQVGGGRYRAWSAGSAPRSRPHPQAVAVLQRNGHETAHLRSKGWNRFLGAQAPVLDIVITLCDRAANEPCPVWPGLPLTAHWGLPDPVLAHLPAGTGHSADTGGRFAETYLRLQAKISALVALDQVASDRDASGRPGLQRIELQHRLDAIAQLDAA